MEQKATLIACNKENIEKLTGVKLHLKQGLKDESRLPEWEAQEEWYNAQVGIKKGRKKDKKLAVDIGNIVRASGVEIK